MTVPAFRSLGLDDSFFPAKLTFVKWGWSYRRPIQGGEVNKKSITWVTPKCPVNPIFALLLLYQNLVYCYTYFWPLGLN